MAQKLGDLLTLQEINEQSGLSTKIKPVLDLTPSENQIIVASKGISIREIIATGINDKYGNSITLFAKAHEIVKEAYGYLGYNSKTKDEIDEMAGRIASVLEANQNLTIAEVILAMTCGLEGDYLQKDEIVIFSPANLARWIKAWFATKRRQAILREIEVQSRDEKLPSPVPPREKILRDLIETVQYHKGRKTTYPDEVIQGGSALYEMIEEYGIFTVSDNQKWLIYAEIIERSPKAAPEAIKVQCRAAAYNAFLLHLIENDLTLTEEGKLIPVVNLFD